MCQQAPPGSQEYKPGLHGPLSRVVYESGRWIGRGRFRQRLQHLCRRGSREHGPGAWAWWQAGPLREVRTGADAGRLVLGAPGAPPGSSVASRLLLSGTAAESLSWSPGKRGTAQALDNTAPVLFIYFRSAPYWLTLFVYFLFIFCVPTLGSSEGRSRSVMFIAVSLAPGVQHTAGICCVFVERI